MSRSDSCKLCFLLFSLWKYACHCNNIFFVWHILNWNHIYQLEKLRPEFQAGLDELTRFIFERTRPKQVAGTIMTGPVLAGVTQSFLDALNNGAVPTISSSWQVFCLLSYARQSISVMCRVMHVECYNAKHKTIPCDRTLLFYFV